MLVAPAVPALPWMAQVPLQATGAVNDRCGCCRQVCTEKASNTATDGNACVQLRWACNRIGRTPRNGSQPDHPGMALVKDSRQVAIAGTWGRHG